MFKTQKNYINKLLLCFCILTMLILVLPKNNINAYSYNAENLIWVESDEDDVPYFVYDLKMNEISNGFINDEGDYYYSKASKIVTGWQFINDAWYYFDADGILQNEKWIYSDNKWYFVDDKGIMVTGDVVIDDSLEQFDSNGVWYKREQVINIAENVDLNVANQIIAEIDNIPYDIKKFVKEYNIINESFEKKFGIVRGGRINGIQNDGCVYLLADFYHQDVALHESLHAFDYGILGDGHYLSESSSFAKAYYIDLDKLPVNTYNVVDEQEVFVLAAMMYLQDADNLAQSAPTMYKWMDEVFSKVGLNQ